MLLNIMLEFPVFVQTLFQICLLHQVIKSVLRALSAIPFYWFSYYAGCVWQKW